jgi:hypothetical protein
MLYRLELRRLVMERFLIATLAFLFFAGPVSVAGETFDLLNSVDDTFTSIGSLGENTNNYTSVAAQFGKFPGAEDRERATFLRWALDIPRASQILTSTIDFTARSTKSVALTSPIHAIDKDNKWETAGGYNTTNYATGALVNAIPKSVAFVSYVAPTWNAESVYSTPDISILLQAVVDELGGSNEYDPLDSENKYVGFVVDIADGGYVGDKVRAAYTYDDVPAKAAELDVTFTPRGDRQFMGGNIVGSDGSVRFAAY